MNKIGILRNIHHKLKYTPLDKYLGLKIPVDINNPHLSDDINEFARLLLKIDVQLERERPLHPGVLKYGLMDLRFKANEVINYPKKSGIEILRENNWMGEEEDEEGGIYRSDLETLYEDNLKEINRAVEEDKSYLRVFARVETGKRWFEEKNYLVKQLGNDAPFYVKPEDKVLEFTIMDACFTNYPGIWFLKHFYL